MFLLNLLCLAFFKLFLSSHKEQVWLVKSYKAKSVSFVVVRIQYLIVPAISSRPPRCIHSCNGYIYIWEGRTPALPVRDVFLWSCSLKTPFSWSCFYTHKNPPLKTGRCDVAV